MLEKFWSKKFVATMPAKARRLYNDRRMGDEIGDNLDANRNASYSRGLQAGQGGLNRTEGGRVNDESTTGSLDRRKFLKGAGAAGVAIATMLRKIGFRVRLVRRFGAFPLAEHVVGVVAWKP